MGVCNTNTIRKDYKKMDSPPFQMESCKKSKDSIKELKEIVPLTENDTYNIFFII